MQVICKLKRKGGTKIDIAGREFHFAPNEHDDHVCDIDDEAVLHRLVNEIPEAYALYGKDAGKAVAKPKASIEFRHPLNDRAQAPKEPETFVITNGDGDSVDLMAMERDALATFAKDQFGIACHARWSADTIRAKIREALRNLQAA